MTEKKVAAIYEPATFAPLTFDAAVCNGCNRCVEVCQVDILIPNVQKGKPPIVLYPGECWYGGTCVEVCPRPGAISLNSLSINRVQWKLKNP
ncbi:MAG: ferredoxin family protein [Planctomycetes bacterium]|nr:ferredoxin family protein [Planctomycetota bacterium]